MSKSLEILKKYKTTQFVISEICVDESKAHLTSEFAIEKIRSCLSKNNVSFEKYKQLEQDLERLEQLEKDNQELKESIEIRKQMNIDLIELDTKLKTENEQLKQQRDRLTIDNGELVVKVCNLEKENQELIVNKNVAQAVALNQKREIGELKDQISYLKEDGEEWQSAYEWSQTENSILKLENEELKEIIKANFFYHKNSEEIGYRKPMPKYQDKIKEVLSND